MTSPCDHVDDFALTARCAAPTRERPPTRVIDQWVDGVTVPDAGDRAAAAPYRTHADLLAEMRAITAEGVEPALRLRNPDLVASVCNCALATPPRWRLAEMHM